MRSSYSSAYHPTQQFQALERPPFLWPARTYPFDLCAHLPVASPFLSQTRCVPASVPLHLPHVPSQRSWMELYTWCGWFVLIFLVSFQNLLHRETHFSFPSFFLSLSLFVSSFSFSSYQAACRIIVPWSGSTSVPLQWKHSVNHRTVREYQAHFWNSSLWPPDAKNWLIRKDPDSGKY